MCMVIVVGSLTMSGSEDTLNWDCEIPHERILQQNATGDENPTKICGVGKITSSCTCAQLAIISSLSCRAQGDFFQIKVSFKQTPQSSFFPPPTFKFRKKHTC